MRICSDLGNSCANLCRNNTFKTAVVVMIALAFFALSEYLCDKLIIPCNYSKIIATAASLILTISLSAIVNKFLGIQAT